ncbi:hypothetical protein KEM48_004031 [Puccinia striiformis f. sp. tritici PST-130]|nr:hypothetical protein KEM48_004031 [Puccinia striiformis f. sp. tritici PST-130]
MHLIFQLGTIYCIECGATPVCLGNWCQSCVNASACIPSTLPAVAFQPPTKKSTLPAVAIQPPTNKPKSAHEIVRLKRQEAIQQALSFQSNAIPNPVTQSQPSQNLAIANSQAVMAQFSASSSQVGPYESLDLEELNGMKDATQKYSLQSGISQSNPEKRDPISEDEYNGSNSSLPSGDFSTCSKVKNGTKTEKHPVDKHSKTIITHFKGNAPFIARPRVIDLNPSSHWAHGVNTKNIISDFVQKHICTQACKRLGLPDLEEIHWSPKCGITNRESRSASINTQKNPEDIKLISFIRQGKKALGFS